MSEFDPASTVRQDGEAEQALKSQSGGARANGGVAQGAGRAEPQLARAAERIAAAFGQAVGLMMRSPEHKYLHLADLERMLLPPLSLNQFLILVGKPKGGPDIAVPLAVALWARVSQEVDKRLSEHVHERIRLAPAEWASGDIYWLVDMVGAREASRALLAQLGQGALKDKAVKMRVKHADGAVSVQAMVAPDQKVGS